VAQLITAVSLEGPDGIDVSLMFDQYRKVRSINGLAGVRVREVVRPRTGRPGSVNQTKLRDDAQVIVSGFASGEDNDRAWMEYDTITRALVGAVDTDRLLKWSAGSERHLQMNIRLTSMEAPIEVGPNIIAYQATLRGSDPTGYSQALQTAFGEPLASGEGGGMDLPLIFPIIFNPAAGGNVSVTNLGTAPTYPTILLSGYLRNPIVQLGNSRLVFVGEVSEGDTLHIDMLNRTVLLNGTDNRIQLLQFEASQWFAVPVGTSIITLLAEDFTAAGGINIEFRHAYE
jgi:hypothetical protein